MESTLQKRVYIGRQHEGQCYQICYYLLQDEKLAFITAQNVMKRLLQHESVHTDSSTNIAQYIKKESIMQSVQVIYSEGEQY